MLIDDDAANYAANSGEVALFRFERETAISSKNIPLEEAR
jgi:hypothetical protein